MPNLLRDMVEKRKLGLHSGIPSFCCANRMVIEAILEQAQRFDDPVLIEATSNQVNQFGGYMRMTPVEFRDYVLKIADQLGFSHKNILMGGDHLGPLPWADRPAEVAMRNASELVRQCVMAGYQKIHLDTSMPLGDDPKGEKLSDDIIAYRGAVLYEECEKAYEELKKENPCAEHPVFVIGSEVPTPGGRQDDDDNVKITTPQEFEDTLLAYRKKFHEMDLDNAWNNIIAIVVQPGVEFSNINIHPYNRKDAKPLCDALKHYPDIVFEGHSTDFQSPEKLREMVEDGIAIIKVGPALTYALREALFSLSMMERELITDVNERGNFIEVLEEEMLDRPEDWQKYYKGSKEQQQLLRKYSFSDRSRYYTSMPRLQESIEKMFNNLDSVGIPIYMLHQYMPAQYIKVRDGQLPLKAYDLAKNSVKTLVEDYNYAVKLNYVTNGIYLK